jgi:curved DNA-binding protein CbpA
MLACNRGEMPGDVRAVVLTQARLSRLEHAYEVLLDTVRREDFDLLLASETTQSPEPIWKVGTHPLEPPFDSFGLRLVKDRINRSQLDCPSCQRAFPFRSQGVL